MDIKCASLSPSLSPSQRSRHAVMHNYENMIASVDILCRFLMHVKEGYMKVDQQSIYSSLRCGHAAGACLWRVSYAEVEAKGLR